MNRLNPVGLRTLRWGVVHKDSQQAISLHSSKEEAEEFRNASAHFDVSETVELIDEVSYYKFW